MNASLFAAARLRRRAVLVIGAASLLISACAVTPGMRPRHSRQVTPAPGQAFSSIVLVMMPVGRPVGGQMGRIYEETWGRRDEWRQAFFRRLERNFAHNGMQLKVFDASATGRALIEPDMLQLRVTTESHVLEGSSAMSFGTRYEASNKDTRYLTFSDVVRLQRSPEREADRQTWLILNALHDGGLIKAPMDGATYLLAPTS